MGNERRRCGFRRGRRDPRRRRVFSLRMGWVLGLASAAAAFCGWLFSSQAQKEERKAQKLQKAKLKLSGDLEAWLNKLQAEATAKLRTFVEKDLVGRLRSSIAAVEQGITILNQLGNINEMLIQQLQDRVNELDKLLLDECWRVLNDGKKLRIATLTRERGIRTTITLRSTWSNGSRDFISDEGSKVLSEALHEEIRIEQ